MCMYQPRRQSKTDPPPPNQLPVHVCQGSDVSQSFCRIIIIVDGQFCERQHPILFCLCGIIYQWMYIRMFQYIYYTHQISTIDCSMYTHKLQQIVIVVKANKNQTEGLAPLTSTRLIMCRRNSWASCCLLEENSGCPLLTRDLNIRGETPFCWCWKENIWVSHTVWLRQECSPHIRGKYKMLQIHTGLQVPGSVHENYQLIQSEELWLI